MLKSSTSKKERQDSSSREYVCVHAHTRRANSSALPADSEDVMPQEISPHDPLKPDVPLLRISWDPQKAITQEFGRPASSALTIKKSSRRKGQCWPPRAVLGSCWGPEEPLRSPLRPHHPHRSPHRRETRKAPAASKTPALPRGSKFLPRMFLLTVNGTLFILWCFPHLCRVACI